MTTPSDANPLLRPSGLPFGMPDYSVIDVGHYLPAFEAAIAEHRDEVAAIIADETEPTFENTLVALERSGATLNRVARAFHTVSAADATDDIQVLDEQVSPLMAAHHDFIALNTDLFDRIRAVYDRRDDLGLSGEDRRLVERRYAEMVNAGVALDDRSRARLTEINGELSILSTLFQKKLLADTNDLAVVFHDRAELDGLSEAEIASAAQTATERGHDGAYVIPLRLFTSQPELATLRRAASRRRLLEAALARGSRGNDNDTSDTLLAIVRLRAERAELLGFASAADHTLALQTAGTAENAQALLRRLAPAAARNARHEAAERHDALGSDDGSIHAADWPFATEIVRQQTYALDRAALRPWFEAERVLRDGVFFAAEKLYGLTFAERDDLRSYHPGVRIFEVTDADGSTLGLYLLDLYTRDSKRGGAWMNAVVTQSTLLGDHPVVVNNLNVAPPAPGERTLLTLDEVTTLFHEFGHALHGLFSDVTYPHFSGTSVPRDFVEFPSQVNEMWILWPEVLANYARHIETGEPLPVSVVSALAESTAFNEGYATSEYLASAWIDQAWHSLSFEQAKQVTDVAAFEAEALRDIGLDNPSVPPRYSSRYYQHIFAGGYGAGYYSYIWSEVLDADTVDWFRENGGLTRQNGDRFRQRLLSRGGSADAMDLYRDFRGRDAAVEPLLDRRGLA